MTKISQRRVRAKAQTYEQKVAEVYDSVVKPVLAEKHPKPRPDYFGILFGLPAFFLGFPLLYVIYFPICAIIMESFRLFHWIIAQLFRLL